MNTIFQFIDSVRFDQILEHIAGALFILGVFVCLPYIIWNFLLFIF
ncbi:hypothetical protein [Metabacillus sp. RGM 3146]